MAIACLALALTGCARSQLNKRALADARQSDDPYKKALQQALVRQQLGQMRKGAGGYRLGANDVIEIHVFDYDKMNSIARVGENGCINLPPLGEINVAGLTERQLESLLQDRLRGKYLQYPHVTVLVKEPHAMDVAVVGEVTKPGRYSLMGEKSVLDLLAEAGGLTEKAGSVAFLIRIENDPTSAPPAKILTPATFTPATLTSATLQNPLTALLPGAKSMRIDLDELLIRGEDRWNIFVQSGDVINVPEAGWVHVTGLGVEKPGTYPLTRSVKTLRQIIDEAEGLKWEASNEIFILHKSGEGVERVTRVYYKDILRDTRKDVPLNAGDTVITDRTATKAVLAAIGRGIVKLVHVGIYGSIPIFSPA